MARHSKAAGSGGSKPDCDESIRYAILGVVATCAAWSTLHYLLAARTLRQDLLAKGE
jgi:hypothetical protein